MLGLAAALLATTASAELWIPSIFSGSGKTAPVHQPHGSAHPTRAAAAGERDDTRGSAHKLRGNFGTGIVVPADDAEVPKTPDPVDVPKIDVPSRRREEDDGGGLRHRERGAPARRVHDDDE